MAFIHLTAAATVLVAPPERRVLITVNGALTGTITVADNSTATVGSNVVGIITNPAVGNQFEYWDFNNGVVISPSATTDITVNVTSSVR